MTVGGQGYAPGVLPPGKRTGVHFIGGWVDLDYGKSRPHLNLILATEGLI